MIPQGAHVVVIAHPHDLATAPATLRVIHAITPDERLERYRQHTGIDLRELDELVWAETSDGSILVVRGPFSARLAVAEIGARMLPMESSSEEPFVRRAGHYQGARRDLVAISDHVLLSVTGAPALTQAVLARVRGEDGSPGALADEDVAALLSQQPRAAISVIAPEPLRLPPGSGVALLLAREEALMATLVPAGPDALDLTLDLRGRFPTGADQNFRALVESLAESDLGAAVGMRDALPTLSVQADDSRVVMRATVPAAALAAGLRVLFDAEISELVSDP